MGVLAFEARPVPAAAAAKAPARLIWATCKVRNGRRGSGLPQVGHGVSSPAATTSIRATISRLTSVNAVRLAKPTTRRPPTRKQLGLEPRYTARKYRPYAL